MFERVKGKDFTSFLKEEHELNEKILILQETATAIAALHESGCINRDIKPGNIMVGVKEIEAPQKSTDNKKVEMEQTKVPYAKLIDQGMTVDMKSGYSVKKQWGGTPRFMASEVMFCQKGGEASSLRLSPASDVFSFGITLLEATCNSKKNFNTMAKEVTNNVDQYVKSDFKASNVLEKYYKSLNARIESFYPKDAQSQFLCNLIQKCCSLNPADRPSVAQVAYCLEIYTSTVGTEEAQTLKFNDVLQMAQQDRPKGIPLALREMLQSKNKTVYQKGCQAILNLGEADPSYKQTPSYGLTLLRSNGESEFKQWASSMMDQNLLYNLKNRITTKDIKEDNTVWDSKDIKVSQKEYKIILEAFNNRSGVREL